MRLTIATLRRVVKGDLTIQFVPQALTSYGGLELLGRYLHRVDLGARLGNAVLIREFQFGLPPDQSGQDIVAKSKIGAGRN